MGWAGRSWVGTKNPRHLPLEPKLFVTKASRTKGKAFFKEQKDIMKDTELDFIHTKQVTVSK